MKIAELERASGMTRSTLHHYRNLGLLPPPLRRGPKLHLYGEAHLERLRDIQRLRARGMSLEEVRGTFARREQNTRQRPAVDEAARPTRPGVSPSSESPPNSVRSRILDSAAQLFTEQGFEAVHVADVARAAGVGKATLYQYFQSKTDLFVECIDRLIEAMTAAQARYVAEEGSSFDTAVEQYTAAMIASYGTYRMMISALGAAAFGDDPKLAERARAAFYRIVMIFEPALRRAVEANHCRPVDSEMVAFMTWGALVGVGARLDIGDNRYTSVQALRIYLDFVSHGLIPRDHVCEAKPRRGKDTA